MIQLMHWDYLNYVQVSVPHKTGSLKVNNLAKVLQTIQKSWSVITQKWPVITGHRLLFAAQYFDTIPNKYRLFITPSALNKMRKSVWNLKFLIQSMWCKICNNSENKRDADIKFDLVITLTKEMWWQALQNPTWTLSGISSDVGTWNSELPF